MPLSETRKRKQSAERTRHLMGQFWEAGREENRATLSGGPRHFICQTTKYVLAWIPMVLIAIVNGALLCQALSAQSCRAATSSHEGKSVTSLTC